AVRRGIHAGLRLARPCQWRRLNIAGAIGGGEPRIRAGLTHGAPLSARLRRMIHAPCYRTLPILCNTEGNLVTLMYIPINSRTLCVRDRIHLGREAAA